MQARFATNPKTGITRWRTKLKLGCLWKHTMQVRQLSMYSRKVPKLEARVMVKNEFGSLAIVSCVRYPTLDRNPCGRAAMAESAGADASPKYMTQVKHPTTAVITAKVQMALCGVRFVLCSAPMESGNSWSLPMAYVT